MGNGSLVKIAEILLLYFLDTGKERFTYNQIKSWYFRYGLRNYKIPYVNDRTLDRTIRALAEKNYLERKHVWIRKTNGQRSQIAIFKITYRLFEDFLDILEAELRDPISRRILLSKFVKQKTTATIR